ncbi:hypothetical protein GCM10009840_11720 [Pseudolysinimonas kribbensis]|jgi:hypothetical protein|uniref:Lactonase family protein n=1 Tax=Pseudolysinimonas kribbensis TaxID=433641 RepID=A0ABQ6K4Q1_9MICO|nr:hypothetical protein [Pseudolysinimonas kribbensis]GMA95607.1 hypothetical protein GCM10025881_24310 [Pseudolysinimonas kribbensis]
MRTATRWGLLAAATAALVAGTAGAADAAPTHGRPAPTAGTVFVQTDDASGNQIVAYDRAANGTLSQAGVYATGGPGGALDGSVVDHTASQGAVAIVGDTLITVNAGSNTITTFRIVGDRLVRRQTISSGGEFPVSVTSHGNEVYVLNARHGASVQGYVDLGGYLAPLPGGNRRLGLPDSTPEFVSTAAEVAFTPDGSKLVVSTKGSGSGFDVFRSYGLLGLSARPVVSTFAGAAPFGFVFDRGGHLVATESGTNTIATFAIQPSGTVTRLAESATGQKGTCWIVGSGDRFWTSNAGSGTLSRYTDSSDGRIAGGATTPTDAGTVDAAVSPDGSFLYVQTGAAGIVDEFSVAGDGSLTEVGSVTVPNGVGAEGIVVR